MKIISLVAVLAITTGSIHGSWFQTPQEKIVQIRKENSIMSYPEQLTDETIQRLDPSYKGIGEGDYLDKRLKEQDYHTVLLSLATEFDYDKRIKWLENHSDDGLLMFELGYAYFLQNPTLETYCLKTLPCFTAAKVHVTLDAVCASDKSVSSAPGHLEYEYVVKITDKLNQHYTDQERIDFFKSHYLQYWEEQKKYGKKAIDQELYNSTNLTFHSPTWVFPHGLQAYENYSVNVTKCWHAWGRKRVDTVLGMRKEMNNKDREVKLDLNRVLQETFGEL